MLNSRPSVGGLGMGGRLKKILNLAFVFILSSCTSSPTRSPNADSQADKPRHIIFFIHGVGGSITTFSKLDVAMKAHLNRLDPHYRYETKVLSYETGDDHKDYVDFTINVAEDIDKTIQTLGKEDKISFITHSQGGIVALNWIYNVYLARTLPATQLGYPYRAEYFDHIQNVITLGTPFWGSKLGPVALWLKNRCTKPGHVNSWICNLTRPFTSVSGDKELEGVSYNSARSQLFRRKTLDLVSSTQMSEDFSQIRMMNVAGVALGLNALLQIESAGRYVAETDIAVGVPSARFDFIYADVNNSNYQDGEVTPSSVFKETKIGREYLLTDVFHSLARVIDPKLLEKPEDQLTPQEKELLSGIKKRIFSDWYSLSQVGVECIENLDCDSHIFKSLVYFILSGNAHLTNYSPMPPDVRQMNNKIEKQMTTFVIDLNVVRSSAARSFNEKLTRGRLIDQELKIELDDSINENNNRAQSYLLRTSKMSPTGTEKVYKDIVEYSDGLMWKHKKYVRSEDKEKGQVSVRNYYVGAAIESHQANSGQPQSGTFKDRYVRLKISAPHYKSRTVDVLVRPTYTTYLQVNLEPR